MVTPVDASLSAIHAYTRKMNVTAKNVANVNTDGFKKSRTIFSEGSFGGVEATVDQLSSPGYTKQVIENGRVHNAETSNVDLVEELTETMTTPKGYTANLKTIQTHDEMLGTLLDTIG